MHRASGMDRQLISALAAAAAHRDEWLRAYRSAFGYVCLVLRREP